MGLKQNKDAYLRLQAKHVKIHGQIGLGNFSLSEDIDP